MVKKLKVIGTTDSEKRLKGDECDDKRTADQNDGLFDLEDHDDAVLPDAHMMQLLGRVAYLPTFDYRSSNHSAQETFRSMLP